MTAQIVSIGCVKAKAVIWGRGKSLLYFYGSPPQLSPCYLWFCHWRVHRKGWVTFVRDVRWTLEVFIQAGTGRPAVYHNPEETDGEREKSIYLTNTCNCFSLAESWGAGANPSWHWAWYTQSSVHHGANRQTNYHSCSQINTQGRCRVDPRKHDENMQNPHRKVGFDPEPSSCKATVLTNAMMKMKKSKNNKKLELRTNIQDQVSVLHVY